MAQWHMSDLLHWQTAPPLHKEIHHIRCLMEFSFTAFAQKWSDADKFLYIEICLFSQTPKSITYIETLKIQLMSSVTCVLGCYYSCAAGVNGGQQLLTCTLYTVHYILYTVHCKGYSNCDVSQKYLSISPATLYKRTCVLHWGLYMATYVLFVVISSVSCSIFHPAWRPSIPNPIHL